MKKTPVLDYLLAKFAEKRYPGTIALFSHEDAIYAWNDDVGTVAGLFHPLISPPITGKQQGIHYIKISGIHKYDLVSVLWKANHPVIMKELK